RRAGGHAAGPRCGTRRQRNSRWRLPAHAGRLRSWRVQQLPLLRLRPHLFHVAARRLAAAKSARVVRPAGVPRGLATPELGDLKARKRILSDLEGTLFVEAGAGTGKTTVSVRRIVNLVAAGRVTMNQLVAITFTEAAAAELRDRIREALER